MQRYIFKTNQDVANYINELIENGYNFHLDDDPTDCLSHIATKEDLELINLNHADLWKFCNPWNVLEKFPKLENLYMGRE